MNPENGKENQEEHRRADFASKKGEIVLRKHEYDGIQEYDQKLPNWWLLTFFSAIGFYLIYWFVYYQAGLIKTDQQAATEAIVKIQKEKAIALEATLANLNDEVLVNEWATDNSIISEGEKIYSQVCIGCHGPGLDAPNKLGLSLVDHEWKYLFKLINEGSPAESTGMPPTGAKMIPWGATYSGKQIAQVVAYLIAKVPEDFEKFKK
jgi:cytochrome c oxidase cbb3-type subunit 3